MVVIRKGDKIMKSCRNCGNATHSWGYRPDLVCKLSGEVMVRASNCLEENKASDTYARTIASRCKAYLPETNLMIDELVTEKLPPEVRVAMNKLIIERALK